MTVVRPLFTRRTWAETLYVIVSVPLAVTGFAFVVISSLLGIGLSITIVGLPVLALGGFAAQMGGIPVSPPGRHAAGGVGPAAGSVDARARGPRLAAVGVERLRELAGARVSSAEAPTRSH